MGKGLENLKSDCSSVSSFPGTDPFPWHIPLPAFQPSMFTEGSVSCTSNPAGRQKPKASPYTGEGVNTDLTPHRHLQLHCVSFDGKKKYRDTGVMGLEGNQDGTELGFHEI